MRQKRILLALISLLTITNASGQNEPELDRLDEKLTRHLEKKMPGWTHQHIEPIQGSKGVLLQKWTSANRGISIAVTPMKSAEEAKKAMLNFPAVAKEAQFLADIGDEAYAWGYDRRQLHFRRGKTIFDVEVGANVDSDPDARNLTWAQRRAREKAEVTRLTRDTAKHLTEAIDAP